MIARILFRKFERCDHCNGTPDFIDKCDHCNGAPDLTDNCVDSTATFLMFFSVLFYHAQLSRPPVGNHYPGRFRVEKHNSPFNGYFARLLFCADVILSGCYLWGCYFVWILF